MLLFMDGMAHYGSSDIATKYSTLNTSNVTWSIAAEGRVANCLKRVNLNNFTPGYLDIVPLTNRLGTWSPTTGGVVGFAIKVDDLSRLNSLGPVGNRFLAIHEGTPAHMFLVLNAAGTFSLYTYDGNNNILLAQSVEGLTNTTWLYFECKWILSTTSGLLQVRVNNTVVLTFSGNTVERDFLTPTLGVWNTLRLFNLASEPGGGLTIRVCDLYLADLSATASSDVSDYLGDGTVQLILPDGPGASTGWTPNTGANWAAMDETPADGDATYVAATIPGVLDTYSFQNVPAGAEIKGVHVNILPRKETAGASSIAPVVHQGGVDYIGPTQGVANTVYDRYLTQAYDLNPATGVKFTATEINSGEFGVKKIA